jgi:hypothetical protein
MAIPPTIRVPHETPMYEPDGSMSRTWIIFFEKQCRFAAAIAPGDPGPFHRTLLVRDTAVRTVAADVVPIYVAGEGIRIIGVLRKVITADLVVRFRIKPAGGAISTLTTVTIPLATAIYEPVVDVSILDATLGDLVVLIPDVMATDGSYDKEGVASFTLQWA